MTIPTIIQSTMKFSSFILSIAFLGATTQADPGQVANFSFDLTGSSVVDDCTGQLATVVSGKEHVVFVQECNVRNGVTKCSFENHNNLEDVKIVWADGTVGNYVYNDDSHGKFTFDSSTFSSTTTERYLDHTGVISRGSGPNEQFFFKQACTFTFASGSYVINCAPPTLRVTCRG